MSREWSRNGLAAVSVLNLRYRKTVPRAKSDARLVFTFPQPRHGRRRLQGHLLLLFMRSALAVAPRTADESSGWIEVLVVERLDRRMPRRGLRMPHDLGRQFRHRVVDALAAVVRM